jgi:predicted Zn-dependent peptidase
LSNGLALAIVERASLPVVELRLVLLSGTASDRAKPGLATIAAELTKAGGAGAWNARALLERAEALGTDLNVQSDWDSTQITLGVLTGNVEPALEILAALAVWPRFDSEEFRKLRQREIDRSHSLAKSSASYAASMLFYRGLYAVEHAVHPYSRFDALPHEFAQLALADCQAWHRQHITPNNAVLVAVGDVEAGAFEQAAARAFDGWRGVRPPEPTFPRPQPLAEDIVYLADRPGSAQSQVLIGRLGPPRQAASWPPVAAYNQALGGGVAGRLFLDVREQRSLAYSTGSSLEERAHGPVPIVLSAGTRTEQAPRAVEGLLENLRSMRSDPPDSAELSMATTYLADSFLFRTETVGALAELTARLSVLSLPDDYYERLREQLRQLDPREAAARAGEYFESDKLVMVVAGDAAKLAEPLARFGKVVVVDPQDGFARKRTLPQVQDDGATGRGAR